MAQNKLIPSVKGTREFYPEEMAIRNFIYQNARKASELFGFQEWDAPFLESIELYAAKSGEELVKEQSFVFPDRGGDLITLRPELTPSLARMVAQRQNQLNFPLRWWSFGPFWRYERPQRGRSREFFQWNVDLIGPDSPLADAEILAIGATFLKLCGLKSDSAIILVNNRKLMDKQFEKIGIPKEKRLEVSNAVDRRNKLDPEKWDEYILEKGIDQRQLDELKLTLSNSDLWRESEELCELFSILEIMGLKEYIKFDPNIMRGLLYYTGTVFEAFDVSGSVKRAIFGGGRYNNLLADVGGDPLSAVGFAMGDVVIGLLLRESGLIDLDSANPAKILVTVFDSDMLSATINLATKLRDSGINALLYPEIAKLPKQFKFADKIGARFVLVLGPDEFDSGKITVKDLENANQQTVEVSELISILQTGINNN